MLSRAVTKSLLDRGVHFRREVTLREEAPVSWVELITSKAVHLALG